MRFSSCALLPLMVGLSSAFVTPSYRSTPPSLTTILRDALDTSTTATEEDATISYTLNQGAFLESMDHDMDELMKPAGSPLTTTPTMDFYERASSRLQRLAQASMAAYPMADQQEVEAIAKKNVQERKSGGGPTTAFAMLGVALTAATVAQNPVLMEEILAIDVSSFQLEGLPSLDQLDMPGFDAEMLDQMSAQVSVMKDSFVEQASQIKENLQQVDGFKSGVASFGVSFESIKDTFETQWTNIQASVDVTDIKMNLQDTMDSTSIMLQTTTDDAQDVAANLRDQIPAYTKVLQDTVAVQTAGAQITAQNLQSSLEASLQDVQQQLPVYTQALQDTVAVQTADAQTAMLNLQSSLEVSLLNVQEQLPVYTKTLQDTVAVQTADAQTAMVNLQSSLEVSIQDVQQQLPVYTKALQDTVTVQTADAQTAMVNLQSSLAVSLQDAQEQLLGVVGNVQQTVDSQVGDLKGSISGLQTVMDAQVSGLQDTLPGKVESVSADIAMQLAAVQESMQAVVLPTFSVDEVMIRATDTLSLDAVSEKFSKVQAADFPDIVEQAKNAVNELAKIELPKMDVPPQTVFDDVAAAPIVTTTTTLDLSNLDIFSVSSADIESVLKSQ